MYITNKAARFAAPDIEREDPRFHCEGGGVYQLVQNRRDFTATTF
jgi:hypothetical protein